MTPTNLHFENATSLERRERLRAGVTRWTDRIAAGAYWPSFAELAAVVALCEDEFLPWKRRGCAGG